MMALRAAGRRPAFGESIRRSYRLAGKRLMMALLAAAPWAALSTYPSSIVKELSGSEHESVRF